MWGMKMIGKAELERLIETIRLNCDISDTQGSAIFSICGMALRLRDLNKWEQGLLPWQENDPAKLVAWIDEKETLWESLEGRPFEPLSLDGQTFDPFDTDAINEKLSPYELYYGAGYAHSLKPTFVLAALEKKYTQNGVPVIILGQEWVRDLLTIPALSQTGVVMIRRAAARLFFWDQMVYLKKSGQRYLKYALKNCGLKAISSKSRTEHFETLLTIQEQTYIHHEIGEIKDTVFEHETFRQIVSTFPHTIVELLARTAKDLLADTGPQGPLKHIIKSENAAALGFYAAFQDGLFLPLFPELRAAFEKFASTKDWQCIEESRIKGFETAKQYTGDLISIFNSNTDPNKPDVVAQTVQKRLIDPLIN